MRIQSLTRLSTLALLVAAPLLSVGQEVKVFGEPKGTSVKLFASNPAPCPVSLHIELELTNMAPSDSLPHILVIPPATERFLVTTLNAVGHPDHVSYKLRSQSCLGKADQATYDTEYPYSLPFEKGGRYVMSQGYNGTASHQNLNALDFTMPEGTPVLAVRGGIVVKVDEHNNQSCPERACQQYNNYVQIYHADGTFAEYHHLSKNGVLVDVGDKVKAGQKIALSGNTGWTTGPHLHLAIYLPGLDHQMTVPTLFLTGDGKKAEILVEKTWYERKY